MSDALWYGPVRPFRLDVTGDVVGATGAEAVSASIGQIIGTLGATQVAQGEVPWDTEFGSGAHFMRHKSNPRRLAAGARQYIWQAVERYEPRALLKAVNTSVEYEDNGVSLVISITYRLRAQQAQGNEADVVYTTSIPITEEA